MDGVKNIGVRRAKKLFDFQRCNSIKITDKNKKNRFIPLNQPGVFSPHLAAPNQSAVIIFQAYNPNNRPSREAPVAINLVNLDWELEKY